MAPKTKRRAAAKRSAPKRAVKTAKSAPRRGAPKRKATRGAKPVAVTAREWAILETLARRDGRVVERSLLLESVWGETATSSANSLEVLVARLRQKLGADVLRTLRGEGYALGVER